VVARSGALLDTHSLSPSPLQHSTSLVPSAQHQALLLDTSLHVI
jgi:hypothetical protein